MKFFGAGESEDQMADRDVRLNASLEDVRKQLSPDYGNRPRRLCLYDFSDRGEQKRKVALVLEFEHRFRDKRGGRIGYALAKTSVL